MKKWTDVLCTMYTLQFGCKGYGLLMFKGTKYVQWGCKLNDTIVHCTIRDCQWLRNEDMHNVHCTLYTI